MPNDATGSIEIKDAERIVDFWLGTANTTPEALRKQARLWFRSNAAVDDEIRQQFGDLQLAASERVLEHWSGTASGSLALVILLDQFSRNMYRGMPAAWANDALALHYARLAVSEGLDVLLGPASRVMLYHPFHHAEEREAQDQGVELITSVSTQHPDWQEVLEGYVSFFQGHRDIVHQFGRFPHRNETLARSNTAAETEYLGKNKNRYGQ